MAKNIKRTGESRKAFYRSQSESQAVTASQTRRLNGTESLSPCPEQFCADVCNTKCCCPKNLESTMKKLLEMVTHLMEEMKQLRQDKLKNQTNSQTSQTNMPSSQFDALHPCVRAEFRTNDIVCTSNEPKGLIKGCVEEEEETYQDACRLAPRSSVPKGIDNKIYDCLQGKTNNELSDGNKDNNDYEKNRHHGKIVVREETKERNAQHNTQTSGKTRPKEVRSNSVQTRPKIVYIAPRPRSVIHINRGFDERECLANALQFHVEDIVDGLIFHDSELPDSLLADECLTEDECASLRKFHDRKDQIRILLTLVKGRDFRVLQAFLNHVSKQNPEVAQKIHAKFNQNKTDGMIGKLCALCKLEKQFNVKHVADSLWATQAIDDGLYNNIIYSEVPLGAQASLWKKVVQCLNMLDPKKAELAQNKLINALSNKNLFVHLADGIRDMLNKNHGKLTCSCEPRFIFPNRKPSFGGMTSAESYSPASSTEGNDSSSVDGSEFTDVQEKGNSYGYADGMSVINEVNETMLTPSPSRNVEILADLSTTQFQLQCNTSFDKSLPTRKSHLVEITTTTPPDSLTSPKKPTIPKKTHVPEKKRDIKSDKDLNAMKEKKQNTVLHPNSTEINELSDVSPNKTNNQTIQVADQVLLDSGESIPPLPEKENKKRKPLL